MEGLEFGQFPVREGGIVGNREGPVAVGSIPEDGGSAVHNVLVEWGLGGGDVGVVLLVGVGVLVVIIHVHFSLFKFIYQVRSISTITISNINLHYVIRIPVHLPLISYNTPIYFNSEGCRVGGVSKYCSGDSSSLFEIVGFAANRFMGRIIPSNHTNNENSEIRPLQCYFQQLLMLL